MLVWALCHNFNYFWQKNGLGLPKDVGRNHFFFYQMNFWLFDYSLRTQYLWVLHVLQLVRFKIKRCTITHHGFLSSMHIILIIFGKKWKNIHFYVSDTAFKLIKLKIVPKHVIITQIFAAAFHITQVLVQ